MLFAPIAFGPLEGPKSFSESGRIVGRFAGNRLELWYNADMTY